MFVHNILYDACSMHKTVHKVVGSNVHNRVYRIIVSTRTDIVLHTIHTVIRREAK